MKILRFSIPILIIGWIAGIGIKRFWKKFPEFYRSYFVSFVLVALGVVFALFAFRDNIVTQYQMAEIQEQYIRTYVEDAFDGSLPKFLAAFTKGKRLTKEEADEIRKMIDEM